MVGEVAGVNPAGRQGSYEGRTTWRSPDKAHAERAPPIRGPEAARSPDGAKRNPGTVPGRGAIRPSAGRIAACRKSGGFRRKTSEFLHSATNQAPDVTRLN